MTQAHFSDTQRAEGKIKLAAARLARRYPFHAALLTQFKVAAMPSVGTMGVTARGAAVLLLYCPEFVLGTPADELAGVLLHECHHVLFRHILTNRDEFPNEWARVVAEEVTVNEFVKESLPDGIIQLEQFPMLPPLESTAQRYARLVKVKKRFPIGAPQPFGLAGGGGPGGDPAQGDADAGGVDGGGERSKSTVDDHSVWEQARADPEGALAAIRDAVQQAVMEAGTGGLPDALRDAIQALGVGTDAGSEAYHLRGDRQGRLDWRRRLRRYVGQALEARPAFNRPARRFPDLVGVVPGQARRPIKPQVMAVIDTSGSITDELLEMIDGELRRLGRAHSVTVVECDAAIHNVYRYRRLEAVTGRGGTDFRPPLERAFLQQHRPDLVIYFTDGCGPAPEHAPRVPLIWCLVPGGEVPAPWGRVLWMGTHTAPGE